MLMFVYDYDMHWSRQGSSIILLDGVEVQQNEQGCSEALDGLPCSFLPMSLGSPWQQERWMEQLLLMHDLRICAAASSVEDFRSAQRQG